MASSGSSPYQRPDIKIYRQNGRPGTAGCIVRRAEDQKLYILSNAHVMGWSGAPAAVDDLIFIETGPNTKRPIAQLKDWSPKVGAQGPQSFDAAIALLLNQDDPAIKLIGVPKFCNPLLNADMQVRMTGARTGGPHHSTIDKLNFPLTIRLRRHGGVDVPFKFVSLVLCEDTFSASGDSGAAVYDANGGLVGLHSGSCKEGSVFCQAALIFDRFGLTTAA